MTPRLFVAGLLPVIVALIAAASPAGCTTPMTAKPPAAPPTVQSILTAPQERPGPVLSGLVIRVIDGDTLTVRLGSGPITVRLGSIDAPEHDQPGGAEATSALARRLDGRQVELEVETQDQYDRLVAFVQLGGESVNSWMVQQGYAWAYRQYMIDPRYCAWEFDARTYRRGLWSAPPGSQTAPWEWRRAQRDGSATAFTDYRRETVASCEQAMRKAVESRAVSGSVQQPPAPFVAPASVPSPAAGTCRIKGNISESGRIYHLPGSDWYEGTQIDTRKGERWFCTEAEAKAAGWRAAR